MTRIIAGTWRGKKLTVPNAGGVRPTTDRMRERLFSILQNPRYPALTGARVIDLFAGSGALGIEAASRGAAAVTLVENDSGAFTTLKLNLASLADAAALNAVKADALNWSPLKVPAADLIFMDPPYSAGLIAPLLRRIARDGWLAAGGLIVAECHKKDDIDMPKGLECVDERRQGIQRLLFVMAAGGG